VVIKTSKVFDLKCRRFTLETGSRTLVMGILNVTPDSFYDGGLYCEANRAFSRAEEMAGQGADIIDIGGESTRPGSKPATVQEELARILPVLKKLVKGLSVPISVDTYKAEVAKRALEEGADMINDISGLRFDPDIIDVLSAYKDVPVVIMHTYDRPQVMQNNPVYSSLIRDIKDYLDKSIRTAVERGIKKERLIIDPGIGFGKTAHDNLEIIRRLSEFKTLQRPVLIGASRKSFLRKIADVPVEESLEPSLAAVVAGILHGADIVRVHDVKETKRVSKIADAVARGWEEG
jgi:dihydropteroate synthase